MNVEQLVKEIEVLETVGEMTAEVTGIDSNSAAIQQGYAFLCIKGFTVDAHRFIPDAIAKGARVILCEDMPAQLVEGVTYVRLASTKLSEGQLALNFYGNPSTEMNIFGVTGTNGKTTVAKMVHELTMLAGKPSGYAGTVGIEYNRVLEESQNTTGTPLVMHKMLRRMLDEGIKDVAIEVSSHALILNRLEGIDIQTAGFTNLSQDHLDFHNTLKEYEDAKSILFSDFVNDASKVSVLNIDDAVGVNYAAIGASQKMTYSLKDPAAALFADNVTLASKNSTFRLHFIGKQYDVRTNLVGEFNVYNTLCAIGIMLTKGFSIEEIIAALEKFKTVTGRMELVDNALGKAVYVDYAHTPDGLENVLKSVREFNKGETYVVFGCGGDRDRTKRPLMAAIAEQYADKVYVTSDNPRTEDPEAIIADIMEGFENREAVHVVIDRKMAIVKACLAMGDNDVLVVAGKGHEDYQIIGKEKIHFSDVEVIQAV